ncbi:glycosyltransferase [Flagellimonas marinaquae]
MLTIVTPTLNSAKYIKENLESISQLKIPYEHIIVDGGSEDDTIKLVKKYSNVKILHQKEKKGMYHAIDLGFQLAKGKYITWINSDDYIIPEAYENMYRKLIRDKADLCYSDGKHYYINEDRYLLIKGKKRPKFLLENKIMPFIQPCSIYTKNIYKKVNGLDFDNFKISGDLELFIKIGRASKHKFCYLNQVSVIFLKHGNSLGDNNSEISKKEVKSIKTGQNLITKFLAKVSYKINI